MRKTIILYAIGLALAAFVLEWFEYRYFTKYFSTEIYVILLMCAFMAFGIWVGARLTQGKGVSDQSFIVNNAAIKSLGLTNREIDILELLVKGQANKEIARTLDVSPNTVKTHIANLFGKLEVSKRIEAINKARELSLIP
jgi:DNA-binding NarL/FixJ family response regulator